MDPSPRGFAELPRDEARGVPVPFACDNAEFGRNVVRSARDLDQRRVTQCALSRVCGVCGSGLGRPIAFLGTPEEMDRNAFHFPPTHLDCTKALLAAAGTAVVDDTLFGLEGPTGEWVVVTTPGFEFLRAGREEVDRRPTFQPHALLSPDAASL